MQPSTAMASREFKYSPLVGKDPIRLISIRAAQKENFDSIQIDLKTHDGKALSYLALSYTWGPPGVDGPEEYNESERRQIIVNDTHNLLVYPNLFDALLQLRESFPTAHVWIDAICIDQNNGAEKASQVKRMNFIYQNASLVVIWSGKDCDERGTAELVKIFQALDQAPAKVFYRDLLGNSSLRDPFDDGAGNEPQWLIRVVEFGPLVWTLKWLNLPMPNSELWDTAADFFGRRWFKRLWVIQEAVLAHELVVLLGPHIIPWRSVVRCVQLLTRSSILPGVINRKAKKNLDTEQSLEELIGGLQFHAGKLVEANVRRVQQTKEQQRGIRDLFNFETPTTMLNLGMWFNDLIGNTTSPFHSSRKDETPLKLFIRGVTGTARQLGMWFNFFMGNTTAPFRSEQNDETLLELLFVRGFFGVTLLLNHMRIWLVDVIGLVIWLFQAPRKSEDTRRAMEESILHLTGSKMLHWSNILYFLLWQNRIVQVKDPRDRVYGLLGVLKAITEAERIAPPDVDTNYDNITEDEEMRAALALLLQNITKRVIQESEGLAILMTAPPLSEDKALTLPSWVPDLMGGVAAPRNSVFDGMMNLGRLLFAAPGTQSPLSQSGPLIFQPAQNGYRLGVQAFRLGAVKQTIRINPLSGDWDDWKEMARFVDEIDSECLPSREAKIDAFWRTLVLDHTDGHHPASETTFISYAHALSAAITINYAMLLVNLGMGKAVELLDSLTNFALLPDGIIQQIRMRTGLCAAGSEVNLYFAQEQQKANHFFQQLGRIYGALSRQLFVTDTGHIGLGGEPLQAENSIWIISGCPVPLALRPIQASGMDCWEIVSSLYVHGAMFGEAVGNDASLQKIWIA